ncbi:acyltransferase [Knoellia sp. 3-2P3]|uniref:acyltransferase family protein n=1 Tax=unclassified Knoellia TaxID=2618719 RepID=UPI0023DA1AC5|nr:acyltransferase [Knoellia sp. 3-2P3]MDF2091214.1 acyltransferase [Knoellia sp. 3-2P3]
MAGTGPGPGQFPATRSVDVTGTETDAWVARRSQWVDNVKVVLVAAIIVGHAFGSYTSTEMFAYADVRETTLAPATEAALIAAIAPVGLFMIPALFLIAGLLTPRSLDRKGPGAFARERLWRLGLPFAIYSFLLWPALLYALYRPLGNAPGSYWRELVGTPEEALDTGYLWFVGDLLLFSLVYAAWAAMRRRAPAAPAGGAAPNPHRPTPSTEIRFTHLLALAAVVATTTFAVRFVFPFDSQRFVDLNLYQWPECIALFALGVVAARRSWLTGIPDRLRRRCRAATLVSAAAFVGALGAAGIGGTLDQSSWEGGWQWASFVFAVGGSALAVFEPVWLLAEAQRHLGRPLRWVRPAASRSAYGAFVLQGLLLIGLAVALRPVPVPAELKALLVAAGSVAGSFGLSWLLVSRVPGMSKVL